MKKYILVLAAAFVSFAACAQKKSQPAQNVVQAENPDFAKIDEILSKMSARAQKLLFPTRRRFFPTCTMFFPKKKNTAAMT